MRRVCGDTLRAVGTQIGGQGRREMGIREEGGEGRVRVKGVRL